jgi:hypothetical protein
MIWIVVALVAGVLIGVAGLVLYLMWYMKDFMG